MSIGEVIGNLICGMGVLLVVGGLLALFLYLLPSLVNLLEKSTAPMKPSEEPGSLAGTLLSTRESEAPALARPVEEWRPRSFAEIPDPHMAAAVGLALSLYLETMPTLEQRRPSTPGAASPWSLAGRWQAMNARLNLRKR